MTTLSKMCGASCRERLRESQFTTWCSFQEKCRNYDVLFHTMKNLSLVKRYNDEGFKSDEHFTSLSTCHCCNANFRKMVLLIIIYVRQRTTHWKIIVFFLGMCITIIFLVGCDILYNLKTAQPNDMCLAKTRGSVPVKILTHDSICWYKEWFERL